MKKLLLTLALFVGITAASMAQTQEAYCEIVGRATLSLTGKIKIDVDFGQENKAFEGINNDVIKDPATGKPKKFNSMIDALNFMAADGWMLVGSYPVVDSSGNVEYHYIMKKSVTKK
ncbi:MAG: hypothetical protein ACOZCO_03580 [Bacteroidota bacterium]